MKATLSADGKTVSFGSQVVEMWHPETEPRKRKFIIEDLDIIGKVGTATVQLRPVDNYLTLGYVGAVYVGIEPQPFEIIGIGPNWVHEDYPEARKQGVKFRLT